MTTDLTLTPLQDAHERMWRGRALAGGPIRHATTSIVLEQTTEVLVGEDAAASAWLVMSVEVGRGLPHWACTPAELADDDARPHHLTLAVRAPWLLVHGIDDTMTLDERELLVGLLARRLKLWSERKQTLVGPAAESVLADARGRARS